MEDNIAIKLTGIFKTFNGNPALSDVSLDLKKGSVHCIVGENGAGKSTLIKILTGAYIPDSGTIAFNGREYRRLSPQISAQAGIVAVYQENVLAEPLSVAENIYAGREPSRGGFVSFRALKQNAETLAQKYGIDLPVSAPVESLTTAQKQFVKILKSISFNPRVLVLDEPTAMLNIRDKQKVLELVSVFKNEGACVVYISHHLSEVLAIADEVTVLRDGRVISMRPNKDLSAQILTQDMVGRSMELLYHRNSRADNGESRVGKPLFEAKDLQIAGFGARNSFSVGCGEIVAITGMVGSGRTELLESIFGYRKKSGGDIFFRGEKITINRPADAIQKSIGFITEDRQKTGLALALGIAENITCAALEIFRGFIVFPRRELETAKKAAAGTKVKCASVRQPVQQLSGGNQQKVLLSRWMVKNPDLILLDEPTKGVDIGAKYEIYGLLEELAAQGKSVLMVSSDMPEVISISDRVLVMRNGKICCELSGKEINETNIISHALGVEQMT